MAPGHDRGRATDESCLLPARERPHSRSSRESAAYPLAWRLERAQRRLYEVERRIADDDQDDPASFGQTQAPHPEADLAAEQNRILREIQKLRMELQLQPTRSGSE